MKHVAGRAFALTFAAAVLAVAIPAAAAEPDGRGPFVDTDGSVHEKDVAALWAADVTSGCGEWRFCPDEPVTRGQMAAFLTRALDLPFHPGGRFVDTADSRFRTDIAAIAAAEITLGCLPDRYCPERTVTRGQMASFLARALDLPPADTQKFADSGASIHGDNIERLASAGITRGCDVDHYCPYRPVSREEMATLLVRALDLLPPERMPELPAEVVSSYLTEQAGPGAEGWRRLVELFFEPADVDRAIRIIACESKGDPGARNPSSGASGLFQHMPRYWATRSAAAGFAGASIFDPEANVAVAAWLVYDYGAGGWHHWVCA